MCLCHTPKADVFALLAGCYAIEVDHRLKGALQPDCVLDYRRESRIRGNHLVLPLDVAQHKMREHRSPYLPFNRILVLSEGGVGELPGLDFLPGRKFLDLVL